MNYMQITEADKRVFDDIIKEISHNHLKAEVVLKVFFNLAVKLKALTPEFANEIQGLLEAENVVEDYEVILQKVGMLVISIAEGEKY